MSPQRHGQLYLPDGDFIFQINNTLYKADRNPLARESHILHEAFHDRCPSGKCEEQPYNLSKFHDVQITNHEFELLMQYLYQNQSPQTTEDCFALIKICGTLSLPRTGARVRDILGSKRGSQNHETLVNNYLTLFDTHHAVNPHIDEVTQLYNHAMNSTGNGERRHSHPHSQPQTHSQPRQETAPRRQEPERNSNSNSGGGGGGSEWSSANLLLRKFGNMGGS